MHRELLKNPAQMLAIYDRAAQELISGVRPEGHFNGMSGDELKWPASGDNSSAAHSRRLKIADALCKGIPPLRDSRLKDSYESLAVRLDEYHRCNLLYLELRREFIARKAGGERDFLRFFQSRYLSALGDSELFSPEKGEASLANEIKITRVPLSRAQAVAESLPESAPDGDPRWDEIYPFENSSATLRQGLQKVARGAVNAVAAGELLATRYNYLNNFAWLGVSIWRVILQADSILAYLRIKSSPPPLRAAAELESGIILAKSMMVEFLRAHQQDPAKLRPEGYWYGQPYSYLTRDMIDLAIKLAKRTNSLIHRAKADDINKIALPFLLAECADEKPDSFGGARFLEYPNVGKTSTPPPLSRIVRFAKWILLCRKFGKHKRRLAELNLSDDERIARAWTLACEWAAGTLDIFGVCVKVRIDPRFKAAARALDLEGRGGRLVFLPTHQSVLDHYVMYRALSSPELLDALGWKSPRPCVILARTGLAKSASVSIGGREITIFGMTSSRFDNLMEEVDGYAFLRGDGGGGGVMAKVAAIMENRPALIYPQATTAAFANQCFPLQHAVFAQMPENAAMVAVGLRGVHSLWPKCPRGNLRINPGVAEVAFAPPIPGDTALLPRRRALRPQAESAAMMQAIHISLLLSPEFRGAK